MDASLPHQVLYIELAVTTTIMVYNIFNGGKDVTYGYFDEFSLFVCTHISRYEM